MNKITKENCQKPTFTQINRKIKPDKKQATKKPTKTKNKKISKDVFSKSTLYLFDKISYNNQ